MGTPVVLYYYTFRCIRAQYHSPNGGHGRAYLHFTGNVVEIVDFEIDPQHRGQGHGQRFMEEILRRAVKLSLIHI